MNNYNFKITVFTATYNREHTLNRLYDSLVLQTMKDFEWLIIDDGSTDGTRELIEKFRNENKINIRYIYQDNRGKHIAMNNGVKIALGKYFFIVDSDDFLILKSLEKILFHCNSIKNDSLSVGVIGLMKTSEKQNVKINSKIKYLDANIFDIRYKYKIKGDLAKVLKTDILKNYPFPIFENEKFCAESLIWNRIAMKYSYRLFNEIIYVCEYLQGGLSYNSIRNRRKSPNYTCILYCELANNKKISFKLRIRAIINYWRFSLFIKNSFFYKLNEIKNFPLSIILFPIGVILCFKDNFSDKTKISNS